MTSKRDQESTQPVELLDGAVHLLREDPVRLLAPYYIGACPFVFGLLFFWVDMSHDAYAAQRLAPQAALLTLLFLWMKCWQSLFCAGVWRQLGAGNVSPWTARSLTQMAFAQCIVQPLGLLLFPIALLLMVPLFYVFPYYNAVTAFGGLQGVDLAELRRRARAQATLWTMQWAGLLMLLKVVFLMVFLNVAILLFTLPHALKLFTGIETQLTRLGGWLMVNSTFLAIVCAVSYLVLDPVAKVACVLRCFQGEARTTGADLRTALGRARATRASAEILGFILAAGLAFLAPQQARAQAEEPYPATPQAAAPQANPTPFARAAELDPATLDASIDQVFRQRAYSWRMPRAEVAPPPESDTPAADKENGALHNFLSQIGEMMRTAFISLRDAFKRFIDWLDYKPKTSSSPRSEGRSMDGLLTFLRILVIAALTLVALFTAAAIYRLVRNREPGEAEVESAGLVPDIRDESTSAEQLPVDGWIAMFNELMVKGDLRLAMRALYLAGLARLAEANLITLQRAKSNRDYMRELARRAHSLPELRMAFDQNVGAFEAAWYGLHPVDEAALIRFRANHERLRRNGPSAGPSHPPVA